MKGDGACQFRSAWRQLGFSDDKDKLGPESSLNEGVLYTPYRMRLQVVDAIRKEMKKVTPTLSFVQYLIFLLLLFAFVLQNADYRETLKRELSGEYGVPPDPKAQEETDGPFSLQSYLQ